MPAGAGELPAGAGELPAGAGELPAGAGELAAIDDAGPCRVRRASAAATPGPLPVHPDGAVRPGPCSGPSAAYVNSFSLPPGFSAASRSTAPSSRPPIVAAGP